MSINEQLPHLFLQKHQQLIQIAEIIKCFGRLNTIWNFCSITTKCTVDFFQVLLGGFIEKVFLRGLQKPCCCGDMVLLGWSGWAVTGAAEWWVWLQRLRCLPRWCCSAGWPSAALQPEAEPGPAGATAADALGSGSTGERHRWTEEVKRGRERERTIRYV